MQPYDQPLVRRIIRDTAKQDYKLSAFILAVVNSPAFRMSRVEGTEQTTVAAAPAHP